ncbi:hypothetical protein [Sinorhizobium fredii]|uniref:hypothetical protein n=1 Tax=Rhizobium fredii TaxID=380 RepID=UPI0035144782
MEDGILIPFTSSTDDDGHWLLFALERRVLTAFAPRAIEAGSTPRDPVSLGWPGRLKLGSFIDRWTDICIEQIQWRNARIGSSQASTVRPSLQVRAYGDSRVAEEASFPEHFDFNMIPKFVESVAQKTGNTTDFLRLELYQNETSMEFAFWARFGLSYEESSDMPNGNVGVTFDRHDLRRSKFETILSSFIATTHLADPDPGEVRQMLRDTVMHLSPTNWQNAA